MISYNRTRLIDLVFLYMKEKKTVPYTAVLIILLISLILVAVLLYGTLLKDQGLLNQLRADFMDREYQQYLQKYSDLSDEQQMLPEMLRRAGLSSYALHDYQQTIEYLGLYRVLYPEITEDSGLVAAALAESLYRSGKYDQVIEVLSQRDDLEVVEEVLLGLSLLASGELQKAELLLGTYAPSYPSLAEKFFYAYLSKGAFDEALEYLRAVQGHRDDRSLIQLYQGLIALVNEDGLLVIRLYQELAEQIEDESLLYQVYRLMGDVYTEQGMLIEAKQAARIADEYLIKQEESVR